MKIYFPLIIAIVVVFMTVNIEALLDSKGCKAIEAGFLGGLFGGNKCHSGSIQIDLGITAIAEDAFKGGSLTSVNFGLDDQHNMLKTIGRGAFFGNKLTDVDIPDTVTTIGQESFGKNQLMKVKISKAVKTI